MFILSLALLNSGMSGDTFMKGRHPLPESSIVKVGNLALHKIDKFTFRTFCLLVFTASFTPSIATAVDITEQFHRPINKSALRNSTNEADTLVSIGNRQYTSGYPRKALASLSEAIENYHGIGDIHPQGIAYKLLDKSYLNLGRYKEAESAIRRQLAIARDINDFQSQIFGLNNIGTILLRQGNVVAAVPAFREALTIAKNIKNIQGQGISLSNLGLSISRTGDYNQAIKIYENALNFRRQSRYLIEEANTLKNLGDVYLAVGEYQQIIRTYGAALR